MCDVTGKLIHTAKIYSLSQLTLSNELNDNNINFHLQFKIKLYFLYS